MDEDFANNNDHHRRTLDEDSEEPMDADHDNTKEHEGEKDSEDENCLNSVIKCTLDETSLLDPIKRCGSQRRRKKSNLDGLVNDNESDDETTMTRSGSRRQSQRRQHREKGRMSRA